MWYVLGLYYSANKTNPPIAWTKKKLLAFSISLQCNESVWPFDAKGIESSKTASHRLEG